MEPGIWWMGIWTLLTVPWMSTNCSCTVLMPAFSAFATRLSASRTSASLRPVVDLPLPSAMIPSRSWLDPGSRRPKLVPAAQIPRR